MVLYYKLKQKDIIMDSYSKKKHDYPFSCFDGDVLLKSKIDDKPYQELLAIIRRLDLDHPIFEKDGIVEMKN